jgi:hypothetical protein
MTVDTIIFGILSGNSAVTGVVGTKIYPSQAPQLTSFPFVVFETISTMPNNTKSGASEMDKYRIQVTTLSKDNNQANDIADKVRAALDYYKSGDVQLISFQAQNSAFDNISGQDGIYLKYQDYFLTLSR